MNTRQLRETLSQTMRKLRDAAADIRRLEERQIYTNINSDVKLDIGEGEWRSTCNICGKSLILRLDGGDLTDEERAAISTFIDAHTHIVGEGE